MLAIYRVIDYMERKTTSMGYIDVVRTLLPRCGNSPPLLIILADQEVSIIPIQHTHDKKKQPTLQGWLLSFHLPSWHPTSVNERVP
jgi:hypothetical protein